MLDVPPHLLEPLFVDTNISYDLDMSKFPGLDDPEQMYQPALLIATNWSNYLHDDAVNDSEQCFDSTVAEEDLFSLIESCDMTLSDSIDGDTFQALLDDVILDTVTPCDVINYLDSSTCDSDTTVVDTSASVDTSSELIHFTSGVRGQKRRRSSDSEYKYSKKSKMVDNPSLRLPALVSVCPTSNQCAMHRDS